MKVLFVVVAAAGGGMVHAQTVVGGLSGAASGTASVALGGYEAQATGSMSVAAGGAGAAAKEWQSMAAGGFYNTASGRNSLAAGGNSNTASGKYSVAAGGGWSTAAAFLSTAVGMGASINAAHDSAVAISAYRATAVYIGPPLNPGPGIPVREPDPNDFVYTAPSQTCASMGPGSLTLCATSNITLLGAALIVNSVDVLETTGKLTGQVAALQASGTSQASQVAALQTFGVSQASQVAALQTSGASQAAQIAALQAQLAVLQDAFVKQCGAPASNSTGRRLAGCRSVADDAPGAPPQSDKMPFIVGGAIGLALLSAVAILTAMRLKATRREASVELASVAVAGQ
jgi:hypothetical protein